MSTTTIYLTHNTGPYDTPTHFTITHLPTTRHAMVTQTDPTTRRVLRKDIVNLGVIDHSIVKVPTTTSSTGFLLRAGCFDLPITFDQINTLRSWRSATQTAA